MLDAGEALGIIANVGVIAGLIFLAYEVKQNTTQLRRGELNATHEMFSSWRHTIIETPDMAAIWLSGLTNSSDLSDDDRLRFDLALADIVWTFWQLWDRGQVGVVPKGWDVHAAKLAADLVSSSPVTKAWWKEHNEAFGPDFRTAVASALRSSSEAYSDGRI